MISVSVFCLEVSVLLSIALSSEAFVAPVSIDAHSSCQHDNIRCQATIAPFGLEDATDDRYVDIRTALDRMDALIRDSAGSSPSMQDFQQRIQKVVAMGESSIPGAGKGLFATKNIKKGTLIGFYPVHGIGAEFEDGSYVCCGITPEDQAHFDGIKDLKSNYIQYLIGSRKLGGADFGEGTQLFVDVNPGRADVSGCWNGHLVNDGATMSENSEQGMLGYYTASQKCKNCVHIPFGPSPLIAVVTTKKVKKGDELFTTYGCLYWLESIVQPGEECADATEAVQLKARETAQDILTAMRGAQTMYANQQVEIEESFVKL
mmetsp:Transcript_12790/g.26451  ORF Transcript_12790/g.26451 Transcript_12790/m.26451 type:complete len:318 (-) Transcript_12790:382-1335(-)